MKNKRAWLENQQYSGSYYVVDVGTEQWADGLSLTLADCNRKITWHFGRPGEKRAIKKIKAVKKMVDELYEYLVPEKKR